MPITFKTDPTIDYSAALLPPVPTFKDAFQGIAGYVGSHLVPAGIAGTAAAAIADGIAGGAALNPHASGAPKYGLQDGVNIAHYDTISQAVSATRVALPAGAFSGAGSYTLGALVWFPETMPNAAVIITDENNGGLRIDHNSGNLRQFINGSTGGAGTFLNVPWPGPGWHTLLFSFDGVSREIRTEIDGVLAGSATLTAGLVASPGTWGFGSWTVSAGNAEFKVARDFWATADIYGTDEYGYVRNLLNA